MGPASVGPLYFAQAAAEESLVLRVGAGIVASPRACVCAEKRSDVRVGWLGLIEQVPGLVCDVRPEAALAVGERGTRALLRVAGGADVGDRYARKGAANRPRRSVAARPLSDTSSHTLVVNRDCRSAAHAAVSARLPLASSSRSLPRTSQTSRLPPPGVVAPTAAPARGDQQSFLKGPQWPVAEKCM